MTQKWTPKGTKTASKNYAKIACKNIPKNVSKSYPKGHPWGSKIEPRRSQAHPTGTGTSPGAPGDPPGPHFGSPGPPLDPIFAAPALPGTPFCYNFAILWAFAQHFLSNQKTSYLEKQKRQTTKPLNHSTSNPVFWAGGGPVGIRIITPTYAYL